VTPTAEFLLRNTNGGEAGNKTTRRKPQKFIGLPLILAVLEQFWAASVWGWLCVLLFCIYAMERFFPVKAFMIHASQKGKLKDPLKNAQIIPTCGTDQQKQDTFLMGLILFGYIRSLGIRLLTFTENGFMEPPNSTCVLEVIGRTPLAHHLTFGDWIP